MRPKDAVYLRKEDGVLYKTHCECGNICIGETGRYMHERVKEHDRDIRLSRTQPFLNTPVRPGIIHSGRSLSLLTDTLSGTLAELKRLLAQDFTITILTGTVEFEIPEAWMPTIRQLSSRPLPQGIAEETIPPPPPPIMPTMPWIETHQRWARFAIHQSLTTTVV